MRQIFYTAFIMICLMSVPVSSQAKEFTFDFQRVVETTGEATLDLTYLNGDLRITGNDYGRIVISAVKRIHAVSMDEAEEIQAHIEIRVRQSGDKVTVGGNFLKMRDRSPSFWSKLFGLGGSDVIGGIDWDISVPEECNVLVSNSSGKVEISHVRGNTTVRSLASDITLSSIEGNILVYNSAGITRGDLLFGDIEVRQPQGEIDLKWVEGDVRIKSSSARISITQERGTIDLTTSTGSVDIKTTLDSSRDIYVVTQSGNINLKIPLESSGALDIFSETGNISSEIPIAIKSVARGRVAGQFGIGGVKIALSSVSGDVTVAQY